jgi:PilZ domain-containing protein
MSDRSVTEVARRRTDRILAPMRIRVIGNDMSGVSFAEETITVSFNQQGARISLNHTLLLDDLILIKNLDTDIEEEFRVVGAFQQVFGDRREWGVEALNPESSIWGVEFSLPAEGLRSKVLIECAACKKAAQSALSSIEYDVLLATGLISRHCDRCGETTRWRPSEQLLTPEMVAAANVKPHAPEDERRKTRRLRLSMRIRVRNMWGVTDICQTRDVSKAGLCFLSTQNFSVRDEVFITLPFADQQVPVETKSLILWSATGTGGRFYGVSYVK